MTRKPKKRKPKTLADVRKRVGKRVKKDIPIWKTWSREDIAQLDAMRDRRTPRYADIKDNLIAKEGYYDLTGFHPANPQEPRVEATVEDIRDAMLEKKIEVLEKEWDKHHKQRDPILEIPPPNHQWLGMTFTESHRFPSRLPHYLLGILIGYGMCLLSWPWVEKVWTMVGL